VLLLVAAKLLVDTARWADTEWRLVITTLAYLWVIAGMWLTVSPWRLRDLLNWATATERRTRCLSAVRLVFALFLIGLGLTVYRAAEQREVLRVSSAALVSGAVL
jgi:Kef-type K+ transport system membrane component KefB